MRLSSALLLAAAVASAHAADAPLAEQQADAKYQLTYNWQYHPSYRAAYSGTNSLNTGGEKMYTFSTTAHFGIRPWQDSELYFNPEITQGVPFSNNLIGLGAFSNGEITRAGGTNPKLYRQRLFLRQTWNRGGGSENVESDFNQLAGTVDKNRTVLTIGNFSTLDVFDDNAYAKDPRSQFMNWGHWTYAAYDYAADARGFGWGAAVEWYQDDWVLRIGRMSGPKEPNGLPVDFSLGKHYGDQIEVEHSHTLGGQPGKVRVLGWRNRGQLASFKEALDYLNTHPNADRQTILRVRGRENIKFGLGINVEQALNDNAGLFLRAMQADGRTETHAFTEVDGSLAAGLSLKGAAWGRADDGFGVAFSRNTLSSDRRQYLEAGGMSFFIGDGRLNYRPETVLETYYSWGVAKGIWLTGDWQRIANPAYNTDRGPMDIYALRLHVHF